MLNFQTGYNVAREYYKETGELPYFDKNMVYNGFPLGAWLQEQQEKLALGKLTSEENIALSSIACQRISTKWYQMFTEANTYRLKHGNFTISKAENPQLARWIYMQRRDKKAGDLPKEREALLNSINFEWSKEVQNHETTFEEWYDLLKEYIQTTKDTKIYDSVVYKDKKLGKWVARQANVYRAGKMAPERIRMFNAIGIYFKRKSVSWNEYYELYRQYIKDRKTAEISSYYKCDGGELLGLWVYNQKRAKNQNKLPKDRERKLRQLGVEF